MKYNIIYNEDVLSGLNHFKDDTFDAVVTDPPFGINFNYKNGSRDQTNPDDYWEWLEPIYLESMRVLKPGGFFSMWQTQLYFKYFWKWFGDDIHIYSACKNFVQLRKVPINYGYDPIVMFYKPGERFIRPEKVKRNVDFYVADTAKTFLNETKSLARQHPCPRPVSQCIEIMNNFVAEKALVLDGFVGSGTIPIACIKTGRKYIGFEIDKKFYDLSIKRIKLEGDGNREDRLERFA